MRQQRNPLRSGGLELSQAGEQFLGDPFCPLVPSGSFSCGLCLWDNGEAAEGAQRPPWLPGLEGLWGSLAWQVAAPLHQWKPRVQL